MRALHFVKLVLRPPTNWGSSGVDSNCWSLFSAASCTSVLCYFRSKEKSESMLDSYSNLDFCEHGRQRSHCAACGGCAICVHGKHRKNCHACALLVKRRKKH